MGEVKRRVREATRRRVLQALGPLIGSAGEPAQRPRRLLLLRPDHLGDLLFTAPALRALRTALPEAHIALLVGPWNRQAAERLPGLDEVRTCPFPWFDRQGPRAPWAPYLLLRREAERLRRLSYDTAVVLRFDFWWGALLTALAGIPQRLGYGVPEVAPFLTKVVPYTSGRHEVEQNWRLLQAGLEIEEPRMPLAPLSFQVTAEERRWAEESLPDGPWAVLLVGAGAPVKIWPPDSFAEVGNALAHRYGLRLAIAGAQQEAGLVQAVQARLRTAAVALVGLPLGHLAAALERSSLAVGSDSGAMHLAVAMKTPSVHLYGPVSVETFGPWGDGERHRVIRSPLWCVPCNRLDWPERALPDHPCIQELPVSWVLRAAEQVLTEGSRAYRH